MSDLINRKTVISVAESCTFTSQYDRTRYMDFLNYCLNTAPIVDAVPLSKIYRLIEGHSNYHGDSILAALTCVAEGKNVELIKPVDAVPVVRGEWIKRKQWEYNVCSNCNCEAEYQYNFCPACGCDMRGEKND